MIEIDLKPLSDDLIDNELEPRWNKNQDCHNRGFLCKKTPKDYFKSLFVKYLINFLWRTIDQITTDSRSYRVL